MTKTAINYAIVVLAAVVLSIAYAIPATASAAINSSSIKVKVENRGTINNTTSAKSHTGDNKAKGSEGGDGDAGGDVLSDGNNNNGGAIAGDGGNGGDAGAGGYVSTGNADASAGTENALNTSDVDVDLTVAGANDMNSSEVRVKVDNGDCSCNTINNTTEARARTGDNKAKGSEGGDGYPGGDVDNDGVGDFNNGGATAGDGGDGGAGNIGGTIFTGNATSVAGTINMLNTTLLRVRI